MKIRERLIEGVKSSRLGGHVHRKAAEWHLLSPRAGHYYSPIPDRTSLRRDSARIFDRSERRLPGIQFDARHQRELLEELAPLYDDHPFPRQADGSTRYFLNNGWFGASDGLFLHLMLRHVQPKRVIEVGSGFSSLIMLDTNDLFLSGSVDLTFIEPDPRRLRSRLRTGDERRASILTRAVQDLDLSTFGALEAGDMLFVDSSHVAKAGSDVNHLFFEVLPFLANGVLVHFHDIPYPFEYPKEWLRYGYAWNEAYLLRAFLQFNREFAPILWNDHAIRFERSFLETHMPICLEPVPFGVGGSFWVEKQ